MLIQLHLKPTDTRATKAYRLQVKERLYRFNYVSASIYVGYGADWLAVCAGSARSARGKGEVREARRDVSERIRGLSENLVDGAIMRESS